MPSPSPSPSPRPRPRIECDCAVASAPKGLLVQRRTSGKPIDRRDVYRIVTVAGIARHISLHSLRHAAITNALDAGVPLRDAQVLARHADPRSTEHYDHARGNLDRHGVYFLTAHTPGG